MMSLKDYKYVGNKTYKKLNDNNIYTISDILNLKPKYTFFNIVKFDYQEIEVSIVGTVENKLTNYKKNVSFTKFKFLSNNVTLNVLAFNQPYLVNQLKVGDKIVITGKYDKKSKQFILNSWSLEDKFEEISVSYNLTGIYDYAIKRIIKEILSNNIPNLLVNDNYLKQFNIKDVNSLYNQTHFPQSVKDIETITNYFKYDEGYKYYFELYNSDNSLETKQIRNTNIELVKDAINNLGFELTSDQKISVNDIFSDFKQSVMKSRLLLGDVGSGKTVVAAIAAYGMKTAGYSVAFMAPTVILAKQHYENIKSLFKDLKVGLLTSEENRKNSIEDIKNNKYDLIIGTHILSSDDVIIPNLGYIIIDEQHKFGVEQRHKLIVKSKDKDLLYLTATPIPRTLFITLFGNKELSTIKTMPKNRKEIITKKFNRFELKSVFNDIRLELDKGHNAYLIVPSIIQTDNLYGIETILKLTQKYLSDKEVLVLNGTLAKAIQQEVIDQFNNKKGVVLISTTIVEVGIDVKHASRMVIFQSNRFGLSQLHQLRGRIGRSNIESVCYVQEVNENDDRINIFTKTNSGFELSEYDLKSRGPGYYLGTLQSGIPQFKWIDYEEDFDILINIRNEIYKQTL